ncbi:MAG TPA: LLM class F420-dependent oxidoreductase [Acidimicrobiales bacterium]|nr:LLM class F420-dependent oxidoreductase [Acidimicrobiales bacterium]
MELRIFSEPQQGALYDDLLALALVAEQEEFGAFFRSDHYLKMGDVSGLPGPTDAWITLAALARDTSQIRLGTLLSAATFRLPGPLAIAVAQVDVMSGGRVELGLGAGWYEREHTAYGIGFPSLKERFERLEEQLAIITGLWGTEVDSRFDFTGAHYSLVDSPALPKPAQRPRPPIIVGGHGPRVTPRLAAQYADEFNVPFASYEDCQRLYGLVDQACEKIGRAPSSIARSAALVVCCGSTQSEIDERARRLGRDVDELAANGLCGTPAQVAEKIRRYGELGISRLYLQILDLADLDHVRLIAAEVAPSLV